MHYELPHYFTLQNSRGDKERLLLKWWTQVRFQVGLNQRLSSSSSHVGSGIVPVDGVGRISYGHCLSTKDYKNWYSQLPMAWRSATKKSSVKSRSRVGGQVEA